MNLEDSAILKLKNRYSHLHPLIFHRSVERSRNLNDLFDILETIPKDYPIVWDEVKRYWVNDFDILNCEKIAKIKK